MTKKELIQKLETLPDDTYVMLIQTKDESLYSMANTVEVRTITFGGEDIPREELADEDCIVISDEF